MSSCDHNILSPSSFSWWGGYLNLKPNAKIIYPSLWFRPQVVNRTRLAEDMFPPHWMCIQTSDIDMVTFESNMASLIYDHIDDVYVYLCDAINKYPDRHIYYILIVLYMKLNNIVNDKNYITFLSEQDLDIINNHSLDDIYSIYNIKEY